MIVLPWPPSALRPNAGSPGAWRRKSEAAKTYRAQAYWLTEKEGLSVVAPTRLAISFFPPDNRKRDLDNMLAACKSGIDGICDALRINDHCFTSITITRGESRKNGEINVTLE